MARFPTVVVLLALISLFALPGCFRSLDPVSARSTPGALGEMSGAAASSAGPEREPGTFYPLVPGNRWSYRQEFYAELRPLGDTAAFRGTSTVNVERTLECAITFGGATWQVETSVSRIDDQPTPHLEWTRLRQDRQGLYELEIIPTITFPCGTPAGAVVAPAAPWLARAVAASAVSRQRGEARPSRYSEAGLIEGFAREFARRIWTSSLAVPAGYPAQVSIGPTVLTRLRYPLHVGAEWAIRPESDRDGNPSFLARVERQEPLSLAGRSRTAYRIRITSSLFGPNDSVVVWYGRDGFLQLEVRTEFSITDENGVLVGTGLGIQRDQLTSLGAAAGATVP